MQFFRAGLSPLQACLPVGRGFRGKNLARKKTRSEEKFLALRYYNLMFLLFHFFCLTKRNETILRLSENKRKFIFDLLNVSKIKN